MNVVRRPQWLPDPEAGESTFVGSLLRQETVGGAIALLAAVVALVWANVDYASYQDLRHLHLGPLDVEHWAADGALACSSSSPASSSSASWSSGRCAGRPTQRCRWWPRSAVSPCPPSSTSRSTWPRRRRPRGWAIPTATDIAFALAVLAVVGSALPTPLRAFLLTLAVVDDLLVIVIIAVFYTDELSLRLARRRRWCCWRRTPCSSGGGSPAPLVYVPLVAATWWCVHESGVHATIAGVALGLLTRVIPTTTRPVPRRTSEHRLEPLSSGVAVPFFALMSAGVVFSGGRTAEPPSRWAWRSGWSSASPSGAGRCVAGHPVHPRRARPRLRLARPLGVALLAGVGFTVSLLVSDLSFDDVRREEAKTAVLVGSLVSALLAALVLGRRNRAHRRRAPTSAEIP